MYAYEESEKYKEGKFIIERAYLVKGTVKDGPIDDEVDQEAEDNLE